ncbi:hypothetical protein BBO99_00005855 [Phytophthora kernoviae]|uniref:START domain-containing protein n=2 Tax=Phytophthora kernoviae TaxID=325452 RepID=A0A3R7JYD7_9STRA|nr:hypothetical protein G195_009609 [Phytophthora kernoviae 00238/432]KAG2521679.1 hypothetical protein JM16_006102 [Phytophthora kernoviae]KAG2523086.1 hypothetical protein JM18_005891 [Phytophthora kernoviae]RLN31430.1 hypothetical protein BBI17_006377 [Phytophthora kernoviae]RLN78605.1 hypothetical protein BBO99_00005855 [Phytophthora kernoviae]
MGKFPLSSEAFPPVTLSIEQQDALETLAEQQLAMAEAQLDRHILDDGVVDRRRWKPLKTRERISVFRERSSAAFHRQCHGHSQFQPSASAVLGTQNDDDWPLPQLLGVGVLKGTLEDIMYGIHTPTAVHMMTKAVISEDEVVDAQVLQELKGPTIAHPFRFLGLKWLVKAHPVVMGAVVLPRDIVYVEHAGIKTRADGSELGHFLIHSVELPQYPDLRQELGLVRARVSSCVLLRQNADDPNETPMSIEDLECPKIDNNVDNAPDQTPPASDTSSSTPLWQKMSALRVMAESTYHDTKKTTEKTLQLSHSR